MAVNRSHHDSKLRKNTLLMVDYCLLFEGDTATGLIRTLRPSFYVKGGDYTDETLPEAGVVHEMG